MPAALEIEPLMTEIEAARLLGIPFKWLRAERYKKRISFKRVAGHAMYRQQDLVAWQQRGEPCREEDPHASPDSSSPLPAPARRSGTSTGTTARNKESVRRLQAIVEKQMKSLRSGSSTEKPETEDRASAQVIRMKSP